MSADVGVWWGGLPALWLGSGEKAPDDASICERVQGFIDLGQRFGVRMQQLHGESPFPPHLDVKGNVPAGHRIPHVGPQQTFAHAGELEGLDGQGLLWVR